MTRVLTSQKFAKMKNITQTCAHQLVRASLCRGVLLLCLLLVSGLTHAETTNVAEALVKETNPGLQPHGANWRLEKAAITDTNLPRVLLIGDSILNGYRPMVVQLLEGKTYVDIWVTPMWQSEKFNKALANVLDQGSYDVIHMNLGLHGWPAGRIKDEEYEPLTRAFLEVIHKKCPQAKLIWANTTPFLNKTNLQELNPDINPIIVRHNQIDAKIITEAGVPINDFYSLLLDQKELNGGDGAHWKQLAYQLLADVAAKSILRELAAKKASVNLAHP